MEYLICIPAIGLLCLILPINFLVVFSVAGVALADTSIIPQQFIYLTRFVPMGMLCLRALADLTFNRHKMEGSFSLVKVWSPFFLLALASTLYSLEPSKTLQRALSGWFVLIGFGMGFPLYFNHSRHTQNLIRLLSVVMGGTILYSLFSVLGRHPTPSDLNSYERVHGVFTNPNTLGLLAMQIIFPLIYWWQKEKGKVTGKALFMIVVGMGVAVLISGSRASALGFFIGLLVFVVGQSRSQKRALPGLWTAALILVSIVLVAGFFFPEYFGGLFRTGVSSRTILWKRAWKLFLSSPYLGVGFGGSDKLFAIDALYLQSIGVYFCGSHSSLMRLLVELGLIGVLFTTIGFYVLIRRAWKSLPYFEDPKLGVVLLAVIAASLANSFFESWLFAFGSSSTVPFWLFLAMLSHQANQAAVRVQQTTRNHYVVAKESFQQSTYKKRHFRPLRS